MSVFKYFKNTSWSPPIGRQALSVNFFVQIRNEVPEKKSPPSPRATGACRPLGGQQALFFQGLFFSGTYFHLFERVFVIIVSKISAANSYRT